MKGFDPKFKDFPDFIIGVTKEIWEDRNIASLHKYYAENIIVRSPSSIVFGNQGVIAATMSTLAEFPDRTLLGEDVIWSGAPEHGMLSSHRLCSTATHASDGVYGEATGKKLRYRIIADCHARDNAINDEWLIRDQGAIVRQLGIDPRAYAHAQIEQEGGAIHAARPFNSAVDQVGVYKGGGNDNEWGRAYADVLKRMMNADFGVVAEQYDRACHVFHAGGVEGHSHGAVDAFWLGLRASFPSARFRIEHCIGRDDDKMPPRAAIRFSLEGKHDGWGRFGAPSGADVYVMGAAHVEYGPWGLRREWALIDETAIWKQILLHTG